LITSTIADPTLPAGVVAVICVGPTTVTPVAVTPPTVTVAPGTNPDPVIVIGVPPCGSALAGVMLETSGTATT
jgi:hypothetical protein